MSSTASVDQTYEKNRKMARVGETVDIPGGAEAVTITDFSPFGDTVQVSWLQPIGDDRGVVNTGTVRSHRTKYTDDNPVQIPHSAWAKTVYEPMDADETVVFYLR